MSSIRRKVQVYNPQQRFFVSLAEKVESEYWKYQFQSFINEGLPEIFSLRIDGKGTTICYQHRRTRQEQLLSADHYQALVELTTFLCDHDTSFERLEQEEEEMDLQPVAIVWKKCKKLQKKVLLTRFIERITAENQIDRITADNLRQNLMMALEYKILKPEHVIIENGIITDVKILIRDVHGNFRIPLNVTPARSTRTKSKDYDIYIRSMGKMCQHNRIRKKETRKSAATTGTTIGTTI